MLTKHCHRCKQIKAIDEFSPGNGALGRHGYCRKCQNAYAREARAKRGEHIRAVDNARRANNPERRLETERRASTKRRQDPGYLSRQRAAMTARLRAKHNAAARVVSCRVCQTEFCPLFGRQSCVRTCSPQCSEVVRLRGKVRKEKVRRHRKRGAVVTEIVDPFLVFDRDGWRCQICKVKTPRSLRGTHEPRAPELDHIIPLSRGGEHSYRNTQCACRRCNRTKSDNDGGQMRLFG